MKKWVALVCLALVCGMANAQRKPDPTYKIEITSPNKLYKATSIRIYHDKKGNREDLDTGRLMIAGLSPSSSVKAKYGLVRIVANMKWSPDSKFLVLTTVSAGDHSPWQFEAYVYCVEDKSLRTMDETIGSIAAEDFAFTGPHTVAMKLSGADNDFDYSVDLLKETPQMQKQDITPTKN